MTTTNKTIDITEARKRITQIDSQVKDNRVIKVTRRGKEVFAFVDIEYLSALLETIEIMKDPESYQMFMESLDDIRNGRLHDHEDVRREIFGDDE